MGGLSVACCLLPAAACSPEEEEEWLVTQASGTVPVPIQDFEQRQRGVEEEEESNYAERHGRE